MARQLGVFALAPDEYPISTVNLLSHAWVAFKHPRGSEGIIKENSSFLCNFFFLFSNLFVSLPELAEVQSTDNVNLLYFSRFENFFFFWWGGGALLFTTNNKNYYILAS